jgi:MGT family glycosyltransferase
MTHAPGLDILLTTWEGGGNVAPVIGAARRLIAAGHRVRVMADAVVGAEAFAAGAAFTAWHRAPSRTDRDPRGEILRDWEADSDLGGFLLLRDRIMVGAALAYAQDVLDEIGARPVDVIATSEMLLGVMLAAERADVPLAVLSTNVSLLPVPGVPPLGLGLLPARNADERAQHADIAAHFGALLDEALPALNDARATLGMRPVGSIGEQFMVARRHLLATSRAFDFAPDVLPSGLRYVGPLLAEPEWAAATSAHATSDRPLVLVAFSTTFQNQLGAIASTVTAMADLPVEGVVTLGPALAGAALPVAVPVNVRVLDAAPHDALMRRASVVVTHAGHGTVMRALHHRVPMLCLPMGRDQHDNAARVVARGAGLRLDRTADAGEIGAALRRLLGEPSFRTAAARLGASIAAAHRESDLVEELTALAMPGVTAGVRAESVGKGVPCAAS